MADPHSPSPPMRPSQPHPSQSPPISRPSHRQPRPRRFAALRRFWRERVRPRWGAFVLLAIMALVGAYMLFTALTPHIVQQAISDKAGWLFGQTAMLASEINPYALAGGVTLILALSIGAILAFPPHIRFAYLDAYVPESPLSSDVAPISVYLDGENQVGRPDVQLFKNHLRTFLREHGQRADLFYYTDVELGHRMKKVYPELRRLGFRLVDVPHSPFRIANTYSMQRNVVDMELAVHAVSRSLTGPAKQHIVLVCNDQDYIPLIYRLLAGGHSVEVWAATLAQAFLRMKDYFPDRYSVYQWKGNQTGRTNPATANTQQGNRRTQGPIRHQARRPYSNTPGNTGRAHSRKSLPAQTRRQPNPTRLLSLLPPTSPKTSSGQWQTSVSVEDALLTDTAPDTAALAVLMSGITKTLDTLSNRLATSASAENRQIAFRSELGRLHILEDVGYSGNRNVTYWLAHLHATGVLAIAQEGVLANGTIPYIPGNVSPDEAARRFGRFLERLAHVAYALSAAIPGQSIPLTKLCVIVRRDPLPADLSAFGRLLEPSHTPGQTVEHIIHMRFLCQCAGALGLFTYDAPRLARVPNHLLLISPPHHPPAVNPPPAPPSGAGQDAPPQADSKEGD